MTSRTTLGSVAAFAAALALAPAASAAPLVGTGENIQPIAHLDIDDSQKNELELAGNYAYVSYDDGLDIVDISNPANPKTVGEVKCKGGGFGDIDLSPDARFAVFAAAHQGNDKPCAGAGTAATIVDISNKRAPRIISKIDLEPGSVDPFGIVADYVHTTTLDGNRLFLNPQIWAGYPQAKQRIRVFDVSNPASPKSIGAVQFTSGVPAVAHDQFVDHRPDGHDIMYAASVHTTDVLGIDDINKAEMKQRFTSPEMTISHQAQPNHDRKILIVDDESAADQSGAGAVCGRTGGPGPTGGDVGSVHFYGLEPDGTVSNGGATELGSFGLPADRYERTCTAHVFWPAPDQNRLVNAWYSEGARILDFSDPANVKQLGWFKSSAEGQMYWSAKPHRGYIFATDMANGLDIMRYTGEGGAKWPATAGPAEVQRSQWQGKPYVPLAGENTAPLPVVPPAAGSGLVGNRTETGSAGNRAAGFPDRAVGRFTFRLKVKKLSRKRKNVLNFLFFNEKGKKVGSTVRIKKRGARRGATRLTVTGRALPGKYTWQLRRGTKKVIKRGRMTVKATPGVTLSRPHVIYARAK